MEVLDLYDGRKNKLNKTYIRNNGEPKVGEYKQSIHIWLINNKGELLIEKRSMTMRSNPGKWAFVGGVPDAGESSLEGAIREVKEELGIELKQNNVELLISFKREHDFVDVWVAQDNTELKDVILQKSEVSNAEWVTIDKLEKIIDDGEFVPSINLYYDLFKKLLYKSYISNK